MVPTLLVLVSIDLSLSDENSRIVATVMCFQCDRLKPAKTGPSTSKSSNKGPKLEQEQKSKLEDEDSYKYALHKCISWLLIPRMQRCLNNANALNSIKHPYATHVFAGNPPGQRMIITQTSTSQSVTKYDLSTGYRSTHRRQSGGLLHQPCTYGVTLT